MSHLFLQWASKYGKSPFDKHESLIKGRGKHWFTKGYAYWGKFRWLTDEQGERTDLEPLLGEAYNSKSGPEVCDLLNFEIEENSPVYLYLYNPLSSGNRLTIANVVRAFYTSGKLPPLENDGQPSCSHIPDYYFHHKLIDECASCLKRKEACSLKVACNFWFRVNQFHAVENDKLEMETEQNLIYADAAVSDPGTGFMLTTGAFFPVLVDQTEQKFHFGESLLAGIPSREGPCRIKYEENDERDFKEVAPIFKSISNMVKPIYKIGTRRRTRKSGDSMRFKEAGDSLNSIHGTFKGHYGTVFFEMLTTCRTIEQRKRLTEYLNNTFGKGEK